MISLQTLIYVIKAGAMLFTCCSAGKRSRLSLAGMAKAALPWWEVLILSFMAGMYIGVGGVFSIMVAGGVSGAGITGSSAAGVANREYLSASGSQLSRELVV
jgi:hypothetical protein